MTVDAVKVVLILIEQDASALTATDFVVVELVVQEEEVKIVAVATTTVVVE